MGSRAVSPPRESFRVNDFQPFYLWPRIDEEKEEETRQKVIALLGSTETHIAIAGNGARSVLAIHKAALVSRGKAGPETALLDSVTQLGQVLGRTEMRMGRGGRLLCAGFGEPLSAPDVELLRDHHFTPLASNPDGTMTFGYDKVGAGMGDMREVLRGAVAPRLGGIITANTLTYLGDEQQRSLFSRSEPVIIFDAEGL